MYNLTKYPFLNSPRSVRGRMTKCIQLLWATNWMLVIKCHSESKKYQMVKITFLCSVYCIFTFTGDGNYETFVELAVFNTTITEGVAKRYLSS